MSWAFSLPVVAPLDLNRNILAHYFIQQSQKETKLGNCYPRDIFEALGPILMP